MTAVDAIIGASLAMFGDFCTNSVNTSHCNLAALSGRNALAVIAEVIQTQRIRYGLGRPRLWGRIVLVGVRIPIEENRVDVVARATIDQRMVHGVTTTAVLPPSSPLITAISHSGRERSSGLATMRETISWS